MKKLLFFLLVACCIVGAEAQHATDSVAAPWVKSIFLTRQGIDLEPPILTVGSTEQLDLQFDILVEQPIALRYTIVHCDANWEVDDLLPSDFMTGFESEVIEQYDFSFTTLTPFVHYRQTLPARYSTFTHSGNYALRVFIDEHPDSILFVRRFYVTEQALDVNATIGRPVDGLSIERRQQVDVCLSSDDVLPNPQYVKVKVQQNGRTDNERLLQFSGYNRDGMCYRQREANVFWGGNNFRYFDVSNLRTPAYNVQQISDYGGELLALLRPDENRSRNHFVSQTTLNGGMKVNAFDRSNKTLEADYVWVGFSLPATTPYLDGSVHVVGQLTDWRIDSTSRMDYDPHLRAYTKRLLLKQGYYSYQLLFLPVDTTEGVTSRIEGDHFQAPNIYTVYVYLRQPSDLADRLVAVKRVAVR
ncbi:MAG: DUF5103 domain-containing protein [Bacteroidales bacterium]|nr:DUF5103 domain-containing protein [Bacteroidales bacterium]